MMLRKQTQCYDSFRVGTLGPEQSGSQSSDLSVETGSHGAHHMHISGRAARRWHRECKGPEVSKSGLGSL
jgi:hypothetical protein